MFTGINREVIETWRVRCLYVGRRPGIDRIILHVLIRVVWLMRIF